MDSQRLFLRWFFLLILIISTNLTIAQVPWSGAYGNEWLTGKYNQEWIRIGVNENGIQHVKLPASFQNKINQLHLYHRGVEVALTTVTNTDIEFYGVINDGASDALLYKPYTGSRQNPYHSFYSDESAYFLTISSSATKLANIQTNIAVAGTPESYHLQEEIKIYTETDTYDGSENFVYHGLDQSYLVEGKGRSSKVYYQYTGDRPGGDPIFSFPFQLKNLIVTSDKMPKIEILLNGRTFSSNKIQASVGKTTTSLTSYSDLIEFTDFIPFKKEYPINVSSDLNAAGQGYFQLESKKVTDQYGTTGIYSVTYIKLIYPQGFDMTGLNSFVFNMPPTSNTVSNIRISNAPSNAKIYDITDIDNPRIITGSFNGTVLNAMVERTANKELKLFVSNESKILQDDKVTSVTFTNLSSTDNDYIIVTNETLWNAANEYANYRKSANGGSYRTLTIKIKDLYNQFNYGEPSPVALRRFADYMIHNVPRDKHNILLIGPSTTLSGKLLLNREMPGDIPAIGFPGSDILLVEGLTSGTKDAPTIPIGRINATTPEQVQNYLSKVIYYEQNTDSYSWKKKVLHLNGGKTSDEIVQFKTFLEGLVPIVQNGEFGGKVKAVVKQSTIPVEKANVSSDINEGVGMISYMGHGDPDVTDLDMGYISDAANSYQNFGKYPLLYFNGCGVGNIFNGRNNPSPAAVDRLPQSSDWINSSNKGGVAVIANSYYSFQASSSRYLKVLYDQLFGSSSSQLSIGQIQRNVALKIKSESYSDYDIANIHQSLLQGDPALHLIRVDQPDYSISHNEGIMILSGADDKPIGQSSSIRSALFISNGGKYNKEESLPIKLTYTYVDGTSNVKNITFSSVAFQDTLFVTTENLKPLSKISVFIDSENSLKELRKDNNQSELDIDWSIANELKAYPVGNIADIIPPLISVTFNNIRIKNDATIAPNPEIIILVQDNNNLIADTTAIEIFIKPCIDNSCDFIRVPYSPNDIQLVVTESGNLKLNYLAKNLSEGSYELLVSAKDQSGNITVAPYKLRFNISGFSEDISVTASPNPASEYLRFDLENSDQNLSSIKSLIYDFHGRLLYEKDIDPGLKSWYWMPTKETSGLYLYKITLKSIEGIEKTYSGKIAVIR